MPDEIIRDTAEEVEVCRDRLSETYEATERQLLRNYAALLRALPRTADGAVVVPGVSLWYKPDSDGNCRVDHNWLMTQSGVIWYSTMLRIPAGNSGSSRPIHDPSRCYSTRELAEAAAKKKGKGDE